MFACGINPPGRMATPGFQRLRFPKISKEAVVAERTYQNYVRVGLFVTLVAVAMAVVQYEIPTVMTQVMGNFGMDASMGSWLMSIFTLMMVFTALPFGALAQRVGARKVIVIACAIIICGSALGAFATNATTLLVARAIQGVAVTAMTICGPVVIESSVRPEKAGSALGIWGIWGPIGSTIAALATPTVFAVAGMTNMWLLYAVFVAVACVLMLLLVKPAAAAPKADAAGAEAPDASRNVRVSAVFTRETCLFFVGFAGFNVVLLAILSYVPTLLQNQGMDPTLSGFASTLPMLLSMVSSPLFGALSDKTGKTKLLLVITVAALGPCAFAMYTNSGADLWIAAVVMGLVGMGSSGLMIAGFMKVLPDPSLKTIGMGVFITVQGVGQFLGTFLVQALLGPQLDQVVLAGAVVMALGLAGAACLALAHFAGEGSRGTQQQCEGTDSSRREMLT
jgi:MFS family permease